MADAAVKDQLAFMANGQTGKGVHTAAIKCLLSLPDIFDDVWVGGGTFVWVYIGKLSEVVRGGEAL